MRILLFAFALPLFACAPKHDTGSGGDDAGSDYTLELSPPQASITLAASASGYSATQPYTVTAHYPDHD